MTGSVLAPAVLLAASVLVLVGLPLPKRRLGPVEWSPLLNARLVVLASPVIAFVLAGPVAALLGLLAAVLGSRALRRRAGSRLAENERSGAAEALAVLSSELRAGRPPATALLSASSVATGPLAGALHAAAGSDLVGADPVACLLRAVPDSAAPQVLRGLAACWQVCSSTGSSLAAAVERLADSLRAERQQRLEVEGELAGPRATAGMLAVLPLAGIGLAAGLGAHPVQLLLHTPVGLGCLGGGIGLDLLGTWWTSRLVAAAQRVR